MGSDRIKRSLLAAGLFALGVWRLPYWWCAREAGGWYAGEPARQQALAAGLADWLHADLGRGAFHTGSAQFDGEWLFGTYLMAGLGFGQAACEHPALRAAYAREMAVCIDRLMSPAVRAFDREMWQNDPLETLDDVNAHHVAFLGYFNILLGLHRLLDPASPYAELHDRVTAALVRRFEASEGRLLQSYPREVYPVDNCAAIGSIGLHGRATGADHAAFLRAWSAHCRAHYVDARTGLLIQVIDARTWKAADEPRGSGTALAVYFLSFADAALSRELFAAARRELCRTVCGFGGVREYPAGRGGDGGDIDSGPVVCGFGLSPTGFLLGGARLHGDRAWFTRLYATAHVWGAPCRRGPALHFVTGGPLGDAILFAMLTAQPPERYARKEGP